MCSAKIGAITVPEGVDDENDLEVAVRRGDTSS
jgi:hypothetical protein